MDGGRINKSIPALEDNDNVLTFYWHIGQTDKWEGGRERVPRSRSINQWEKSGRPYKTVTCIIYIYIYITRLCMYDVFDFSHGWKHLPIILQVHSISVCLSVCLLSLPNTRPLGYFGFAIGSAASHLTSLRHGFITEPDATRMLCVCVCLSCNSSQGNQLFGKLLREL